MRFFSALQPLFLLPDEDPIDTGFSAADSGLGGPVGHRVSVILNITAIVAIVFGLLFGLMR